MNSTTDQAVGNRRAAGWLLLDMCLHISSVSIVKAISGDYPAIQLVFLRALVGLIIVLPWIFAARHELQLKQRCGLHLLRVLFACMALTAGFHAISQLPLALYTTLSFTRPILLMVLAAIVLHEAITGARWAAAALGMTGVWVAANPGNIAWSWGLASLLVAIVAGTSAVVVLRQLKGAPWQTVMLFYTAGLTLFSVGPALYLWQPLSTAHIGPVVLIGVFAQCAQFCFMRAHWLGEVGFLAPLAYCTLLLSVAVGYFVFAEQPTLATLVGGLIIVTATTLLALANHRAQYRAKRRLSMQKKIS